MTDLQFTFIGSGNAFSPGGLCCNGFLVNDRFLFEAPPQALSSLNTIGFDPNEVEAIVLSHHHGDHFLGLPFLLLHWRWKGRTKPIRIVGPKDTERLGKEIAQSVFPGVLDVPYEIQWIEAQPGEPLRLGELELEAVEMEHDEALSQALGYRCRLGSRRWAYTGDTRLCNAVFDLARDAEVLICECASRDLRIPVHMNLVDDIPHVRAAMPANSQLILTHLAPDVDSGGLPNTRIARDFETFRL